uniref:Serine/arginine repetitive matrix 3 n=1 Tax=Aotus nancymaae TaxID=37293 RepID=A0A2K5E540_AOTNA
MSSTVNNGAASMPSPPDAANGFPQPGASSGAWPRAEEELRAAEPGLVKRAHREILDHERKRRVELKCMELQEMMEEQGYSEEEIRQKVGTFRQMLMEKEGVLTREDRPGGHIVAETPRLTEGAEPGLEYAPFDDDDGPVDCDCPAACYRGHRGYRTKHWSSSSASPPPKKKKKKKGEPRLAGAGREGGGGSPPHCVHSCGSSSPLRKKKKSVKKHRRDRSDSGSRRKRRHRYRLISLIHVRPHTESPGRRSHRHSSGSSHSPSLSSHYSDSRSPSRLSPKHRDEGRKTGSQRSSGSRSPSPSGGSGWGSPQRNGGSGQRSGAHGGRPGSAHSPSDKPSSPSPRARDKAADPAPTPPARGKESPSPRSVRGGRAAGGAGRACAAAAERRRSRSSGLHAPAPQGSPAGARPRAPRRGSVALLSRARSRQRLPSRAAAPRGPGPEPGSPSEAIGGHGVNGERAVGPGADFRAADPRNQRGSPRSRIPATDPSHLTRRPAHESPNTTIDLHPRNPQSAPTPTDAEHRPALNRSAAPTAAHRPLTYARKRPIPYYRPSPSSSSSCLSSDYSTRSHSHSPSPGHSHGSYSSRSRGTRSRTRSPSQTPSPSYHSRSSSESGGF